MDKNQNKGVYVRDKDKALEEAARIADKVAKWKAEFINTPKPVEVVEPVVEEPKGPTKEELKVIKEAELDAQAKAIKRFELEAELKALDEAEKA